MKNASAQAMWSNFIEEQPEYASFAFPNVDFFCDNEDDTNTCAALTVSEIKKATSHSLLGLQLRNEVLPKIGDLTIITNWEGTAQCIIETVSVKLVPFFNITAEYALLEGEGDKSLEYWKKIHWDYYTRELAPFNREPRNSMIVVCETFKKVF